MTWMRSLSPADAAPNGRVLPIRLDGRPGRSSLPGYFKKIILIDRLLLAEGVAPGETARSHGARLIQLDQESLASLRAEGDSSP